MASDALNDGHCHFFSTRFFELLGAQMPGEANGSQGAAALCARLGWDDPGSPEALADRWVGRWIATASAGRC